MVQLGELGSLFVWNFNILLHIFRELSPASCAETQGLSKMTRNHIHLAQGVATDNVISGTSFSSTLI
jgi:RNA:NAD 2'-phosphotransferase (TPT1/KptA family)